MSREAEVAQAVAQAAAKLSNELRVLRASAGGPSSRALAPQTGCSHTTVSEAFSGRRVPTWGTVEAIVRVLGGDVDQFRELHAQVAVLQAELSATREPAQDYRVYIQPRQQDGRMYYPVCVFTGGTPLRVASQVLTALGKSLAKDGWDGVFLKDTGMQVLWAVRR